MGYNINYKISIIIYTYISRIKYKRSKSIIITYINKRTRKRKAN